MVEIYKGQKIHIEITKHLVMSSPRSAGPLYLSSFEIYINNRKISKRVKEIANEEEWNANINFAERYLIILKRLIDAKIYTKPD
jgi:hypothetical protein